MSAVISSRTPEGEPFDCPYCGASDRIEPSRPPGDAPCPSCGHLIWFEGQGSERRKPLMSLERFDAVLRSRPRRPMFGVVATIRRQVRRVIEAHRSRESRERRPSRSGVYDHWLDG